MSCRLILVEGIPGSGKTTTAEWLCRRLNAGGIDARWCDELARPHPFIDRATMRHNRDPDYAQRCIGRWSEFAAMHSRSAEPRIWILEACLFQSSVRFLVEHEHEAQASERYADALSLALADLSPRLVYLVQAQPREFLERQFTSRKGEEVTAKIAAYTETTACARRHGWHGQAGMFDFYTHYRAVCDRLVPRLDMPVARVDTSDPDWTRSRAVLSQWLDNAIGSGELGSGDPA